MTGGDSASRVITLGASAEGMLTLEMLSHGVTLLKAGTLHAAWFHGSFLFLERVAVEWPACLDPCCKAWLLGFAESVDGGWPNLGNSENPVLLPRELVGGH